MAQAGAGREFFELGGVAAAQDYVVCFQSGF